MTVSLDRALICCLIQLSLYLNRKKMHKVAAQNQSELTEFTVLCFSDTPELQIPFFIIFLVIFLIIIIGNIIIFVTITLDSYLHTPMYVFLGSLSILDISYTSTTLPKLLAMLFTQYKTISFAGCMIQLYFYMSFLATEFLLLAAMAIDRYLAICYPLHYPLLMSLKHCTHLVTAVWIVGFIDPIAHSFHIAHLSFCSSHRIDHFFCDVTPVVKLACSDTSVIEILTYINGTCMAFTAFILTLISYLFIISTILKIRSSEGRHKAFSTCGSHLTSVSIFYGTIFFLYMKPTSSYSPKQDSYFALLYIVLIPMLNPVIYTMKNKEFKDTLRKLTTRGLILLPVLKPAKALTWANPLWETGRPTVRNFSEFVDEFRRVFDVPARAVSTAKRLITIR
ncbi:olfactory receptor 5AR1-like [Rhinophrynus dorsalis]